MAWIRKTSSKCHCLRRFGNEWVALLAWRRRTGKTKGETTSKYFINSYNSLAEILLLNRGDRERGKKKVRERKKLVFSFCNWKRPQSPDGGKKISCSTFCYYERKTNRDDWFRKKPVSISKRISLILCFKLCFFSPDHHLTGFFPSIASPSLS